MIRLGLLRHGHTAWNRAGQLQGRTDIPLDDAARAQLQGFGLPPEFTGVDVVASPLSRAMETARIVSGIAPTPIPALTEMNWGDWEGAKGVDLRADPTSGYRDIEHWGWSYRPPNGESVGELRDRLRPWIAGLQRDTLAVCHIGVMRVILALAHGWDFDGPAPFAIKRNRIFVVQVDGDALTPMSEPIRLQRLS